MDLEWDEFSGRNDPAQRYRIYRLCPGETELELVATCGSEEAVGVTICTLAREGEFDPEDGDCAIGILDLGGDRGRRWLIRPWLAVGEDVSRAGRILRTARMDERKKSRARP